MPETAAGGSSRASDGVRRQRVPTHTIAESEFALHKLDNGLTVAFEEMHEAPTAALRIYVRAGSILEGDLLGSGISHFFEHLLAGGTTTRRGEEEARALAASIGGQMNAYTTSDHTCYYIKTLSRHFDTALELLSDWVMRHQFTENEFQREQSVILEEMRNGEADPNRQAYRLMQETVFKEHPARLPVIGERALFSRITQDDLRAYYRRMYVPGNMIFVAAGDFDPAEALEKVQAQFADLEARPAPVFALPDEPRQLARRTGEKEMDVEAAYQFLAFRTVPLSHHDLHALDVLSNILSHGDSSRLVRSVREEKKLAYSIQSWSYTPPYHAGTFGVRALCEPDKADEVEGAVMEVLRRIRDDGIADRELLKAKKQVAAERYFGMQTASDRASDLGISILSAHDPRFTETYVEDIQRLKPEDIARVAGKYFKPESACLAVVRPRKAAEEAKAPARSVVGPKRKEALPNGTRLIAKANPSLPTVSIRAVFLGGVRAETPEENGIGSVLAEMLTRGTTTRSAEDIATELDAMGAHVSADSGNNSMFVQARCMKEDLDATLEILADCVINPSFPEDELAQVKRLSIAAIQRRNDNWRYLLSDAFHENFFRVSPYRMRPEGSEESVGALTREQLAECHRERLVAENMVIAVFGDVDAQHARRLVEKRFAAMRRAPDFAPPSPPPEPKLTEDRRVDLDIQRQDLASVFVGYSGLRVDQERDREVMDVIDALTSGITLPGGWLHDTLRGKEQGLVYEVHAYSMAGLDPGYFGAYAACAPENAEEVVQHIHEQIARTLSDPIDPKELETAKETCVTAHAMGEESNGQQAMRAALDELYGLGYDASDDYAEKIRSVTEEDIHRVAREYLAKRFTLVILPPESEE